MSEAAPRTGVTQMSTKRIQLSCDLWTESQARLPRSTQSRLLILHDFRTSHRLLLLPGTPPACLAIAYSFSAHSLKVFPPSLLHGLWGCGQGPTCTVPPTPWRRLPSQLPCAEGKASSASTSSGEPQLGGTAALVRHSLGLAPHGCQQGLCRVGVSTTVSPEPSQTQCLVRR